MVYLAKIIFLLLLMPNMLIAQENEIAGIYYLEEVMETASGIKLNKDSTFEFFFSQGAMDRTGKGKWTFQNGQIHLLSHGEPIQGFICTKSEKSKDRKNVVVVKENNAMLLNFVYVQLSGGAAPEFLKLESNGSLELRKGIITKIEFLFELCPEKIHSFTPLHEGDNYFEFTINPEIMDIYFDNLTLKLSDGGIIGNHPLLKDKEYFYKRN